ncbi:hypothetical protein CEXT_192841 [Caerostris extrusa]|uniref:Uncharacterized protein n=1 Tax=Caerostris extrusa TaxID=172846 RepID=A0AAV4XYJ7_CAEEX|nr:hypothetical protein CEXT_192841 [Caerostris extrusa]
MNPRKGMELVGMPGKNRFLGIKGSESNSINKREPNANDIQKEWSWRVARQNGFLEAHEWRIKPRLIREPNAMIYVPHITIFDAGKKPEVLRIPTTSFIKTNHYGVAILANVYPDKVRALCKGETAF